MTAPRPKVFGIGLNKTGTKTLRRHLEFAGYRHRPWDGATTRQSPAHAHLALGEIDEVLDELEAWDSCEDWPWPLLFRELDRRFPEARFVLTVRDSPQRWYASLCNMAIRMGPFTLYDLDVYGHAMPHGHRAELETIYETHNRAVAEHFADRPDKLLTICWDRGDDAAQLYAFLGLDIEAPNENVHENRSPERGIYRGDRPLLAHLGRVGYQQVWGHRARPVRWLRPRTRRWRARLRRVRP